MQVVNEDKERNIYELEKGGEGVCCFKNETSLSLPPPPNLFSLIEEIKKGGG